MIRLGIPLTSYSNARSWQNFVNFLYEDYSDVEAVNLYCDENNNELPEDIDIILFDGGSDVHPILYNEKVDKETYTNIPRDILEVKIYRFYKNRDTLFAGICRGNQFLNIMRGGTLIQDLYKINQGHTHRHRVDIESLSTIIPYINCKNMFVNSLHHQAINELGVGLKIVMKHSTYNTIEGIESIDGKIRAIQSHPEFGHRFYEKRLDVMKWLLRIPSEREKENVLL